MPKKFSHNTVIEIIWTVVPVLILVWIAKGSFPLLYEQDVAFNGEQVAEADVVDIKVYGNMWYWDYTYNQNTDKEFVVESRILKAGDADRPLVPARGDLAAAVDRQSDGCSGRPLCPPQDHRARRDPRLGHAAVHAEG